MSIYPTANIIDQNEMPYWIIVSDEGPAKFPYKHATYNSAYKESLRLSKLAPGIKFNVFKYGGHAFTPKPVEVQTTFRTYQEVQYPYYHHYQPSRSWWSTTNSDDSIPF